ncbi:hypothetical protein [Candidatus Thiosymbion oneisti]|uniref:hypothetical protein n=1 Tax=Candidatus Thiosymbion oneisti TaxID=589554 RepID=UPI001061E294|nr:hypothetical protein [Candidatus Thiosymbion oneisti]
MCRRILPTACDFSGLPASRIPGPEYNPKEHSYRKVQPPDADTGFRINRFQIRGSAVDEYRTSADRLSEQVPQANPGLGRSGMAVASLRE